MKILLHLESRSLNNGEINPKNYPYKKELLELLKDHEIKKITSPIPLQESKDLIAWAEKVIAVDSYLQHLCWYLGKQAIVLWGQSDSQIFGHPENINLLKSKSFLRHNQFEWWENAKYNPDAFVKPEEVVKYIYEYNPKTSS